ncbi:hypothetical protein [Gemmatimonas sp.]|uniref:hypothetical protein n=1 Tax=Gemmatimonas sp. TaxID=1962908 RepID=UPI0035686A74
MNNNCCRVAHRLALDLAKVCTRVAGPDFGDLIDDGLLQGDPAALMDVMWSAQQVAWWASQRSCYELDLLGECMHEYRHLIACIIDGYSVSSRSIAELCRGMMSLGCQSAFVQLHGLCALDDALDIADAFDDISGFDDLEAA